ncbi:MAG TPA: HEPN domain-containing protein [bacterium]|nr:HEPN domain-containing protein [bacterium]HPN45434.1 HEPN domain-containing protein [bacterium]
MRNETEKWLAFADDHLAAATILLDNKLNNPCLQNAQQAIEKALKAIFSEQRIKAPKTHDILALKYLLKNNKIEIPVSDSDCDFINSLFLPSMYPVDNVLAVHNPDKDTCLAAIKIAQDVVTNVKQYFSRPENLAI